MTFLLRSTTTGDYTLTLAGTSQSGGAFSVWFNNAELKSGVSLPTSDGNVTIPFTVTSLGMKRERERKKGPN